MVKTKMSKLKIMMVVFLVVSMGLVRAQNIQTVDCEKLFNSEYMPQDEFEELADICFYGSGYEGKVNLTLEGETTYSLDHVETSNGILSSMAGGVRTFFENIGEGIYRLIIDMKDNRVEYGNDVVVSGEDDGCDDCVPQRPHEVPEFSTLAAVAALTGAGLYVRKRRQRT